MEGREQVKMCVSTNFSRSLTLHTSYTGTAAYPTSEFRKIKQNGAAAEKLASGPPGLIYTYSKDKVLRASFRPAAQAAVF